MNSKRPIAVTVIGWTWIVLASLMCLSGVGAILVSSLAPTNGGLTQASAVAHFDAVNFIFDHFKLFAAGQVLFAAGALWTAASFLHLHKRARGRLEVFTWCLMAVEIALVGIIFAGLLPVARRPNAVGSPFAMYALVIGLSLISGLPILVPCGVILYFLRSSRVRLTFAAGDVEVDDA